MTSDAYFELVWQSVGIWLRLWSLQVRRCSFSAHSARPCFHVCGFAGVGLGVYGVGGLGGCGLRKKQNRGECDTS